jgi:hypothetical protein
LVRSGIITLQEATNPLIQSDLKVTDSESGGDFCAPNRSYISLLLSVEAQRLRKLGMVHSLTCLAQQFELLQQHKNTNQIENKKESI